YFWWSGMKRDVATFVSKCLICQQVKIEHQQASGLPQTQRRHDAIWVVVDRLTKSAHFIPIRKDYSVSRLAEIFQQEIIRLHGTPSTIVSDRDSRFASRFWKGLQKAWGTRLKFSTAFHPQTDGQIVSCHAIGSYFMIHLPSRTAMLSPFYMFISMPYTIARAICMHEYDMLSPTHRGTMTMTYEAPVS
nr:retrotransposable element Tf2 [Tanacetum cinerariifolium]